MPGEARESRLTINAWKNMEGELFWPFDDDMFASWIPPNHMMILWAFKKTL